MYKMKFILLIHYLDQFKFFINYTLNFLKIKI